MRRRAGITAALSAFIVLASASAASGDTIVPRDESVTEITVIGDDVTVDGRSTGSIVLIDGDLTVGRHGQVLDGVTLIGGQLHAAPGARIQGDVLQIGRGWPRPSLWTAASLATAVLLVRLAMIGVLMRIAMLLAERPTTAAIMAEARLRPIRTVIVGALVGIAALAGAALLAVTVVGLPLATAILAGLMIASSLGLGLLLAAVDSRASTIRTVFAALALPILGDGLVALAAIVGLGSLAHHVLDRQPAVAHRAAP